MHDFNSAPCTFGTYIFEILSLANFIGIKKCCEKNQCDIAYRIQSDEKKWNEMNKKWNKKKTNFEIKMKGLEIPSILRYQMLTRFATAISHTIPIHLFLFNSVQSILRAFYRFNKEGWGERFIEHAPHSWRTLFCCEMKHLHFKLSLILILYSSKSFNLKPNFF